MSDPKYHLSADGIYRPCNAQVSCPLGGDHLSRAELIYKQNEEQGKTTRDVMYETYESISDASMPHWRLFLHPKTKEVIPICLQDHDYRDYDPNGFLDEAVYTNSLEAQVEAKFFNKYQGEGSRNNMSAADKELLKNARRGEFNAFSDVYDQLDSYEQVHYRLYCSPETGKVGVVCVQYFDYVDYDAPRFMGTSVFFSAEDAREDVALWNGETAWATEVSSLPPVPQPSSTRFEYQ